MQCIDLQPYIYNKKQSFGVLVNNPIFGFELSFISYWNLQANLNDMLVTEG